MTAFVSKSSGNLKNFKMMNNYNFNQIRRLSVGKSWSSGQKRLLTAFGVLAGGAGALIYALDQSVKASDLILEPPNYPWHHKTLFGSFDHASLRRGYEVYKQVCAACHSIQYVSFRNLVNVTHTEQEAKREAADYQIQDGPDEEGEMFFRAGKLTDYFPNPYKNEIVARNANNGALPPDLTYITLAREPEENYIFSLLTGYMDPPAGMKVNPNQHFNPYFAGGMTAMAQALYDDVIEYEDGTPATASQLAKDIANFLAWCSHPELETRKLIAIKTCFIVVGLFAVTMYMKRLKWSVIKSRKILFKPPTYKQ